MKKIILVFCLLLPLVKLVAQADTVKPAYFSRPLPRFTIQLVDSNMRYTNDQLPKNKQVILIWFNPDCEHCQAETKLLTEHISQFDDAHIVMATYQPYDKMKEFYYKYEINKYPGITMGRDKKYFIGNYFSVRFVPFIAVYDRKYALKKVHEGGATIEQLVDALKE